MEQNNTACFFFFFVFFIVKTLEHNNVIQVQAPVISAKVML